MNFDLENKDNNLTYGKDCMIYYVTAENEEKGEKVPLISAGKTLNRLIDEGCVVISIYFNDKHYELATDEK